MLTTLNINIKEIAEPLVGKPKAHTFDIIKAPPTSKKTLSLKLNNKLDVFILAIEGSYQHLKELDKEKSKKLLKDTDEIVENFYSLDDLLSKKNYLDHPDLKNKIKYLFKALYKFESILHKNTYKDSPINKTSQDIIDNISKINRNTLSKLAY